MQSVLANNYHAIEVIYEGRDTILYRAEPRQGDAARVVLKTPSSAFPLHKEITRLRHEYDIASLFDSPCLLKARNFTVDDRSPVLELEDFNGKSLSKVLASQSLDLEQVLTIAIQMANGLDAMHRKNVIHRDVKSANVICNLSNNTIKLADFGLASELPRHNPAISSANRFEGTLAYVSPEQTGRMNRLVDYRTDFYSLGVTLYEMLTGVLPFVASDPAALMHAHIARQPASPDSINQKLPKALSDVVMKLLEKNAEDRYQSASGLADDLLRCRQGLLAGEPVEFEVGRTDVADTLHIPQKLYGREQQIDQLLTTFSNVSGGGTELMLVTGPSGAGKSALIREIHKPVSAGGYFISGKFDQYKKNVPYSSLIKAFQDLVQQLLGESEAALNQWKSRLINALGPNGAVITEVIPEVELIIGEQDKVPQLGAVESQNRFKLVFRNFVRVFAGQGHPLTIFLDDLQWADSASLKLMESLLSDGDVRHLMIIGAYRDSEVSATHPLILMLDELNGLDVSITRISLEPLDSHSVKAIVADTLVPALADIAPLAELVLEKTAGSPFFVNMFLNELYFNELVYFEYRDQQKGWHWDIEAVSSRNLTESAVKLMAARIGRLSSDTQTVLKVAACIGAEFDLQTLAQVCRQTPVQIMDRLWQALEQGLILANAGVDLETLGLDQSTDRPNNDATTTVNPGFRFSHDQIQQAAYQRLSASEQQQLHDRIGRCLLQVAGDDDIDDSIFDIVNHLNRAAVPQSAQSRRALARLNLQAGLKARSETAYDAACDYLESGLALVTDSADANDSKLVDSLVLESVEASFSASRIAESEELWNIANDRAITTEEKIRLYELKIQICMVQDRQPEAIATGVEALEMLGIKLAEIEFDMAAAAALPLPSLQQLPDIASMQDSRQLAAFRIMMTLTPVIHHASPELFPKLALAMIRFCLDEGHSELAAWGYVIYGLFLCDVVKDLPKAFHAGQIALDLVDRYYNKLVKVRTLLPYYVFVHACRAPCKDTFEPLVQGVQNALELGDIEFAGYYVMAYGSHQFLAGTQLEDVYSEQQKYIQLTQGLKNDYSARYSQAWGQLTLNLQGRATDAADLHGEQFDRNWIAEMQAGNNLQSLYTVYVCKLILSYLMDDPKAAIEHAQQAEKSLPAAFGLMKVAAHRFYHSLALCARTVDQPLSAEARGVFDDHLQQLKFLAEHSPDNFQHKYQLLRAEHYRSNGDIEKSTALYESAIVAARRQGFMHDEALGCELLGKHLLHSGDIDAAQRSLTRAWRAYLDWGALAKAELLLSNYGSLIHSAADRHADNFGVEDQSTVVVAPVASHTSSSSGDGSNQLDLSAVVKASQAISGEISLDSLLSRLLNIVIEIAGAQRGVLLLAQDTQWCIEAEATTEQPVVSCLESRPVGSGESASVAGSVVNFVARSKQNVVIADAIADEKYSADPYVLFNQSRAILCMPLINQGQLSGIVYLENNIATNAFTPERLEVLNLLSSQAAISIENATLYSTLEERVEERTRELATANQQIVELNSLLSAENRRMGSELEVTQRLQKMMLPRDTELEQVADLDLAGYMEPAEEVGGDYYDVLCHAGRVSISIADVSGHGLESGVVMLMLQTAIRTLVTAGETRQTQILDTLNRTIYSNVQRMQVDKNASLMLLDYADGELNVCGQHEELLVFRANGTMEVIDTNDWGFPIGVEPDIAPFLQLGTLQLAPGDGILLYTDGVTEAENAQGKQYTVERLCQLASASWADSAEQIKQHIITDLREHIGTQVVFDDITLLVVKRL